MNGIFRVDTTDGRKSILRVTLPEGGHNLDHIAAEMDWLVALARDTNLSVPRPLPARNGSLVVESSASGVPKARWCEIFSWVPGKDLAEDMSPVQSRQIGRMMARLHTHALTYQPPANLFLLKFDRVFPFPEPVVRFDAPFAALFIPEPRAVHEKGITSHRA